MRPHHRGVLDALVHSHDGVLPHEREQSQPLLLTREGLRSPWSRHAAPVVRASSTARHTSRSLLATPARRSRRALRTGRLGADARSRSAAPFALARIMTSLTTDPRSRRL